MTASTDDEVGSIASTNKVELMAVGVIFFSILVHAFFHHLEKKLKDCDNVAQFVGRVLKELMIIGVISMVISFFEKHFKWLSESDHHLLEKVHFVIFFIAIGHAASSALLMYLSLHISKHWIDLEQGSVDTYVKLKKEFEQMLVQRQQMGFGQAFWNIAWRQRYNKIVEQVVFEDLRLHFIHSNRLPMDFSFAFYLGECKRYVFLMLGDIHQTAWVSVAVILMMDTIYRNQLESWLVDSPDVFDIYGKTSFITISFMLVIMSCLCLGKTRTILDKILHSEIIKFDPIAANYYIKRRHDPAANNDIDSDSETESMDIESYMAVNLPISNRSDVSLMQRNMFDIEKWGDPQNLALDIDSFNAKALAESAAVVEYKDKDSNKDFVEPTDRNHKVVYEYHPNEQEEMFWFGSHTFMLRAIQSVLALTSIYVAIVIQYRQWVFTINSNFDIVKIAVVLITIPSVIVSVASTMPVYTIIVHIGQLVDVDIVREAKEKAIVKMKDGTRRVSSPHQEILSTESKSHCTNSLAKSFSHRLECWLFSHIAGTITIWIVLLNLGAICLPFSFPNNDDLAQSCRYASLLFVSIFMLEITLKAYTLGARYFLIDTWILIDLIVVVISFAAGILEFWMQSFHLSVLLTTRLIEIGRVSRIGRQVHKKKIRRLHNQKSMTNKQVKPYAVVHANRHSHPLCDRKLHGPRMISSIEWKDIESNQQKIVHLKKPHINKRENSSE